MGTRNPHLLSQPPEIRNVVYRLVLLQNDIKIRQPDFSGAEQPSLLQVSRQIRAETSQIHHNENEHIWYITDFDVSHYMKWQQSSQVRRDAHIKFKFRDRTVWRNLLEWLEAFYYDKVTGLGIKEFHAEADYHVAVAGRMFRMVSQLRELNVAWEDVKVNLEYARQAIGIYAEEWLVDL